MNILLIAGGWSSEREVSLNGAREVRKALEALDHSVTLYDPALSLDGLFPAVQGKDFAFLNLHGSPGEDGLLQAMLERLGCPYQGSSPAGSLLALNKAASKAFFRGVGLLTADWRLLGQRPDRDWKPEMGYPLFIKANTGGSSLGMERVDSPEDLHPALERLFAAGGEYLMEPALTGMEVTCGVLGVLRQGQEEPEALPPILIKPKAQSGIFDYASKYSKGGAEEICPAPIGSELTRRIQQMALQAHTVLGLSGYSRADFIVTANEEPYLLEVNTLPGMTATSLLPQEAAAVGLSFVELIARLLELGLARFS